MDEPRTYRTRVEPTPTASSQAKQLRRKLTPPECRLWLAIKAKKLNGLHFRKQAPLGPYIADFYCHAARLVVEVDGSSHQGERLQHDRQRDAWMHAQGIRVLRISATDVRDHLEGVLLRIQSVAAEQLQLREQAKDRP
ncbi:MAG: hypothetical protein CMJ35_14985 [Phycisphaerae bacterium]|nr:hypothetical protein [Phycisphaerae bacterium]MBM92893.1 hypothetical protein [Phycisphaerae bacterium]